jgi:hypothetical protein
MSSRSRASGRKLTASGIFAHAHLGKANFHVDPDDVGDIDIEVYHENGDTIFSVEAENDGSNSTGMLLELTAEEANALAGQLVRAAEESRGTDQEGA